MTSCSAVILCTRYRWPCGVLGMLCSALYMYVLFPLSVSILYYIILKSYARTSIARSTAPCEVRWLRCREVVEGNAPKREVVSGDDLRGVAEFQR